MTPVTTTTIPHRAAAALVVVAGALMATYLLLRPYGDALGSQTSAAAEAFASPQWIWSHVAGSAALVTLAALWALLATGWARWAAIAGAVLALPYYGAETFALHAIGLQARLDPDALALVPVVRDNPVAMSMFGAGLISLAISGIAAALTWRRVQTSADAPTRLATAYLPLAVLSASFLPQFFLPPAGRMAYGLAFAAAAVYAVSLSGARPADGGTATALTRKAAKRADIVE